MYVIISAPRNEASGVVLGLRMYGLHTCVEKSTEHSLVEVTCLGGEPGGALMLRGRQGDCSDQYDLSLNRVLP